MARGATLTARWFHEPQPISNQPVGLGFPHRAGGLDPGDLRFRLWAVGVVGVISSPEMGTYLSRERRDLDVVPRGNSRRVLAP